MRKISQMPMMPPPMPGGDMMGMPPIPGGDMMGMPPMGGMPAGAPMGGPPAPTGPPPIAGPLDSIGEIIYDSNVDKYIAENTNEDEGEIALSIWEDYGGNPDGTADSHKVGKRTKKDTNRPPDVVAKEVLDTDERKWERLENGKNISEITSLEELSSIMKSMIFSTVKKYSTPPPPPPGAAPPM